MTLSPVPRRRELWLIAVFAVALRVLVFFVACWWKPLSLSQYTAKGDTSSYMAVAGAMTGERPFASLDDYDRRVFPGYPAFIALLHLARVPLPVAALCVTWVCAGAAAGLTAKVFADARVGWAMTCLVPHYLINSSLGMSEAPLLACLCAALLLSQSNQIVAAGVVFGFAGLVRPMACFAVAGVVFTLMRDREWKRLVLLTLAASLTFLAGLVAMQFWTGDALHGVHVYANHPGAYAGHMIVWPFAALLKPPHGDWPSIGHAAYIWLHVVVTLLAVVLATFRGLRFTRGNPRDAVSFPWLLGNTAMVLCIGPPWGMAHFPRFTIPAAPALFWTLRQWTPRRPLVWMAIAAACAVFAVYGVIDSR